ncbi:hypothetical protein VZT92_008684 [Zoarces viviparus]|uniref:Uncharacterized protein n=1 Tax=Zoarces viviparus TaxID=48416 RepID=A0AAW1FG71_ZOAVI
MYGVSQYSYVIQVAAASCPWCGYVTERDDDLLTAHTSCSALLGFLQRTDVRAGTVGLWSGYGGLIGGAEYFLCALSLFQLSQECSPLALTFILGADRLAVIYRIWC